MSKVYKIPLLVKGASYFYPYLIERIKGDITPVLEVVVQNGSVLLNTNEVNYSFGALYKVFKKTFEKIRIQDRKIDKVLILGFGTGSVAQLLCDAFNEQIEIVGVEADQQVIDLGYKYFNLSAYKKLTLHKVEALHFVQSCKQKFDFVVVDIFIDDQTPDAYSEPSFIQSLKSVLQIDGTVLINRMITSQKTEQQTLDLMEYIKKEFGNIEVLRFDNGGSNNWMLLNK